MSKSYTRDVDKGAKALVERVEGRRWKTQGLQVGIIGEKAAAMHDAKGNVKQLLTVGEIAEIHEFGLGSAPQRSFIRGYVDANAAEISQKLHRIAEAVMQGKLTATAGLDLLGLSLVGGMQQYISAGIPPELTAATLRRKGEGKTTPLINSGQLRGSLTHRLVPRVAPAGGA